ncbi:hypothetical protein ACXR2T_06265 [Leucobacter sp. HY1910]
MTSINDLEQDVARLKHALAAERECRRNAQRKANKLQTDLDPARQQVVRLTTENGVLRSKLADIENRATAAEHRVVVAKGEALQHRAAIERRDQTIAGLRSALTNRKDAIHV